VQLSSGDLEWKFPATPPFWYLPPCFLPWLGLNLLEDARQGAEIAIFGNYAGAFSPAPLPLKALSFFSPFLRPFDASRPSGSVIDRLKQAKINVR